MTESLPHMRSVKTQLQHLRQSIPALDRGVDSALEHAERLQTLEPSWRSRATAIAVIVNPEIYHDLDTSVSLEAWKKQSHQNARIEITCLQGGIGTYRPQQFTHTEPTANAYARLHEQQQGGTFLVLPVRIEPVQVETLSERALRADEFDLGLAATVWIIAAHAHRWEHERDVMFAALGERFSSSRGNSQIPVVGSVRGSRLVAARAEQELRNHYLLTGLLV